MAGATLTQAVVVGALRYGETSRIVRLATRDLGVQSAIAKGALRPKSRFGAALQLLAEGTAHLLPGRGELATLIAFDVQDVHAGLARSMAAFHSAAALAELTARFVPGGAQEEPWRELTQGIRLLESAPPEAADLVGLTVLWRMIDALGVVPTLDRCARDDRALPGGDASLSYRDGGLLCAQCATGGSPVRLPAADREALGFFLTGVGDPPDMDDRRAAAHRRLLARWVTAHLAEGDLPALEVWRRGR